MTTYRNTITYTTPPRKVDVLRAESTRDVFGRRLTVAGAQRIIRRDSPLAVVTKVDSVKQL